MPGHEVEDAGDVARFRRIRGRVGVRLAQERVEVRRRHGPAQDPGRRSIEALEAADARGRVRGVRVHEVDLLVEVRDLHLGA